MLADDQQRNHSNVVCILRLTTRIAVHSARGPTGATAPVLATRSTTGLRPRSCCITWGLPFYMPATTTSPFACTEQVCDVDHGVRVEFACSAYAEAGRAVLGIICVNGADCLDQRPSSLSLSDHRSFQFPREPQSQPQSRPQPTPPPHPHSALHHSASAFMSMIVLVSIRFGLG